MRLKKKEEKKGERGEKKDKKWLVVLGSSALVALILIAAASTRFLTLAEKYSAKQPPAEARVEIPIYGRYDFTLAAVPGEMKVPFRPDAVTEVILPPAVVFRTDPSSDIKIVFIDGSQYIDGPGRQVWYGLKRGIFKIRGLKEAGILQITLEKKT
jgi:hypothetical protein